MHRADGDDIKGVDLVELLDVTLVADPDLVDPCAMRVLLDAEGESKMSRLVVDPQLERDVRQRVADMRRLLVEVAEYVRAMSLDGDGVVWMAVTVREKVMKFVGDALGWRMMAVYGRTLKESEEGDVEACAAFLSEKARRLTEAEISPDFPLPLTWAQYYEAQAGWEWPNMKGFPR